MDNTSPSPGPKKGVFSSDVISAETLFAVVDRLRPIVNEAVDRLRAAAQVTGDEMVDRLLAGLEGWTIQVSHPYLLKDPITIRLHKS